MTSLNQDQIAALTQAYSTAIDTPSSNNFAGYYSIIEDAQYVYGEMAKGSEYYTTANIRSIFNLHFYSKTLHQER